MPHLGTQQASHAQYVDSFIGVYRAWHAFEDRESGVEIIDYDLVDDGLAGQIDTEAFECRTAVLTRLRALMRDLPLDIQDREYLAAKLRASETFVLALMGEQRPFPEYIRSTLGVTPRLFSENTLRALRQPVSDLLAANGVRFEPRDRDRFHEVYELRDPSDVRQRIEKLIPYYLTKLGETPTDVPVLGDLHIEFADVDAPWANWLSVSARHGIHLTINLHRRISYLRGSPDVLAAHEFCGHAVHASRWIQQIRLGHTSPACGVTAVHGPDGYLLEGVAHLAAMLLISEGESPDARLARYLVTYRNAVFNNLHHMLNMGSSFDAVFAYAQTHLPYDRPYKIEAQIRDRGRDPLQRAYGYAYGIAEQDFGRALGHPRSEALLSRLYDKPLIASAVSGALAA